MMTIRRRIGLAHTAFQENARATGLVLHLQERLGWRQIAYAVLRLLVSLQFLHVLNKRLFAKKAWIREARRFVHDCSRFESQA